MGSIIIITFNFPHFWSAGWKLVRFIDLSFWLFTNRLMRYISLLILHYRDSFHVMSESSFPMRCSSNASVPRFIDLFNQLSSLLFIQCSDGISFNPDSSILAKRFDAEIHRFLTECFLFMVHLTYRRKRSLPPVLKHRPLSPRGGSATLRYGDLLMIWEYLSVSKLY